MSLTITWVEPDRLACGGLPASSEHIRILHEQGIRAILTLTERPLTAHLNLTSADLAAQGFQLYHTPINDYQPPTRGQVDQAASFIRRMIAEQHPVYVHCFAGIGRTGTMLHAYYLQEGMKLPAARAKIQAVRPESQFTMLSPVQQAFLIDLAHQIKQDG